MKRFILTVYQDEGGYFVNVREVTQLADADVTATFVFAIAEEENKPKDIEVVVRLERKARDKANELGIRGHINGIPDNPT